MNVKLVKVNAKKMDQIDQMSCTKMSIIPVKVHAGTSQLIPTYAFIDNGSTATFCTKKSLEQAESAECYPNTVVCFYSTSRC